mgnify:CR=1 FL=1
MEDRQKIIEKLVKIKALAERGIGGEKQTAQVMYTTLKEKYKYGIVKEKCENVKFYFEEAKNGGDGG